MTRTGFLNSLECDVFAPQEPVTGCGLATDVSLHPEVVSSANLERMSGR